MLRKKGSQNLNNFFSFLSINITTQKLRIKLRTSVHNSSHKKAAQKPIQKKKLPK